MVAKRGEFKANFVTQREQNSTIRPGPPGPVAGRGLPARVIANQATANGRKPETWVEKKPGWPGHPGCKWGCARTSGNAPSLIAQAPTGLPSFLLTTIVADRASPPPARLVFHTPFGCWMLMKKVARSGV